MMHKSAWIASGTLILLTVFLPVFAQSDSLKKAYVEKYARWAVREMEYSGIPASITMAQGLLESGAGTSELALKAYNHFGIKCRIEWTGARYTYQDDDHDNCFRKYESVDESYRDHSHFLMYRPRYEFLFDLDPKDYKAWAYGLKKAGYATHPDYAPMLIKLIDDYNLYLLDEIKPDIARIDAGSGSHIPNEVPVPGTPAARVSVRNRIQFVIAREGDDIKKLTRELDLLNWELRKYNEIPRNKDIKPGQLLYVQPKRKKAESGYSIHHAEPGETMYGISQQYGVKLKWLYKRNDMKPGDEPVPGQSIWLRGMKPGR
jgi:hypothetical protein